MCSSNLKELVVKEVHGSGGYGMLVGPTATEEGAARPSAQKLAANPAQLHRPADAGTLNRSDPHRSRTGAEPCGFAPIRACSRSYPDRARRPDARGAEGGLPRCELLARRWTKDTWGLDD